MAKLTDNLYKLQKKDISSAAKVMSDAFSDDPLWEKIFRGETKVDQKLAACLEVPLRFCFTYGNIYSISEEIEGLAAVMPGNKAKFTLWSVLRTGSLLPTLRMGANAGKKMGPAFEPLDKDRGKNMQGREFTYLYLLGVAAKLQGKGYGGTLLRAVIERSELLGIPLYLETETEVNVAIYERFGFNTIRKIILPMIEQPMWEMVREPGNL